MPQRGPTRFGSRLENARPAVAQERVVLLRCPVRRLPHRTAIKSPVPRRDAKVLGQRRGKRLKKNSNSKKAARTNQVHMSLEACNLDPSSEVTGRAGFIGYRRLA